MGSKGGYGGDGSEEMEVFPLICPACQTPLTFIAFLTEPEPITQILAHIGEPTSPPLIHLAPAPPEVRPESHPPPAAHAPFLPICIP